MGTMDTHGFGDMKIYALEDKIDALEDELRAAAMKIKPTEGLINQIDQLEDELKVLRIAQLKDEQQLMAEKWVFPPVNSEQQQEKG